MRYPRVRIALFEDGLKNYEFARQLNWHPTKLSQIINGAHDPSPDEKRQIANALGKTVAELFHREQVHA